MTDDDLLQSTEDEKIIDYMSDDISRSEEDEKFLESLYEHLNFSYAENLDEYYDIYNEEYSDHIKKKDDSKNLVLEDVRREELKIDNDEDEEEDIRGLSEPYFDDIGDLLASGHTSIESLAGGYEYDMWIKERRAYIYTQKKALEVSTAEKLAEEKKNRDFNEYINGGNPEGYIPSEHAIKIREDWDLINNEICF